MNTSNYFSNYNTFFEPGCKVIYGPHAASAYLLTTGSEIAAEQPVHLLDFGNRCDMYFAAKQLRMLTQDPVRAMRNIRLQRAFTCYQALSLLRQMEEMEEGVPILILDLLAPFLDENIRPQEIDRLFKASIEQIQTAMQTHFILIGVKPIPQWIAPVRMGLLKWVEKDLGLLRLSDAGTIQSEEPDLSQPSLFPLAAVS